LQVQKSVTKGAQPEIRCVVENWCLDGAEVRGAEPEREVRRPPR